MTPTLLILAGVHACGGVDEPGVAAAPSGPPDVVLITLDTTRADRIGAYGSAQAQTPTLDAPAPRGPRYAPASSRPLPPNSAPAPPPPLSAPVGPFAASRTSLSPTATSPLTRLSCCPAPLLR